MKNRRSNVFSKLKDLFLLSIAIGFVALLYGVTKIGCPIKFFTGISCGGCGMTRAFKYLILGDIKQAFYYHPLFPLVFIAGIIYLIRDLIDERLLKIIMWGYAIVFTVVYLYRIISPQYDFISFSPRDGFIYNLFSKIFLFIKKAMN